MIGSSASAEDDAKGAEDDGRHENNKGVILLNNRSQTNITYLMKAALAAQALEGHHRKGEKVYSIQAVEKLLGLDD
jgi:hypothetical protein